MSEKIILLLQEILRNQNLMAKLINIIWNKIIINMNLKILIFKMEKLKMNILNSKKMEKN